MKWCGSNNAWFGSDNDFLFVVQDEESSSASDSESDSLSGSDMTGPSQSDEDFE